MKLSNLKLSKVSVQKVSSPKVSIRDRTLPIGSSGRRRGLAATIGWVFAATSLGFATTTLSTLTAAPASAAPALSPLNPLQPWAPVWQDKGAVTYTTAQAVEIADRYDLVIAFAHSLDEHVATMKATNPALELHVYVQATGGGTAFPEAWYTHDAAGNRIKETSGSNWIMNPRHPAWRAEVLNRCTTKIAISGFDGCFLDSLGTAPLFGTYATGHPIDPATGQVWDPNTWLADAAGLTDVVTAGLGAIPVSGNGLGKGVVWFDPTRHTDVLAAALPDEAMAEVFTRSPGDAATAWPSLASWTDEVAFLADAAARGESIMTTTKLWVPHTPAEEQQWFRFAAATFLLGTDGTFRFAFPVTSTGPGAWQVPWYDDDAFDLGAPLGAHVLADGAHQRTFEHGRVLVNPSATTVTVPLGAAMRDSADTLVTTVTLPAQGAEFLRNDSSAPPVLGIASASGPESIGSLSFALTLSKAVASDITVTWSTVDGTATADGDYQALSSSVTIPAGSLGAVVSVPVNDDSLDEATESFSVSITVPAGILAGSTTSSATITDDDATPSVSVSDVTVVEDAFGAATAQVRVSLSAASGLTVSAAVTATGVTASPGPDYTTLAPDAVATIPAGQTETVVAVAIAADTADEAHETFTVRISAPVGATLGDAVGRVTIIDDDTTPAVWIEDGERSEANGAMTFVVRMAPARASATAIPFTTATSGSGSAATAGTDFQTTTGTVTIPAGATTSTIAVPILADTIDEPDEQLTVTLTGAPPEVVIADTTGTGRIGDDDAIPTLRVNDSEILESSGTAPVTVQLLPARPVATAVAYTTTGGTATATAGADYQASTGTVTIPAGATAATVQIAVLDDTADESNETISVTITAPAGVTGADTNATVRLVDDDGPPIAPPTHTLRVNDAEVLEGGGTVGLTLQLVPARSVATAVTFTTVAGSATAGSDFTTATGTVTIPAGATAATVQIAVLDDTLNESNETFTVTVTPPAGVAGADPTATVRLVDDDGPLTPAPATIRILDAELVETAAGLSFPIVLSKPAAVDVVVGYTAAGASATAGLDFTASSGTVTIAAGTTAASVTIPVTDDPLDEAPTETFTVTLSGSPTLPSVAAFADSKGTGRIIDDDDPAPTAAPVTVRILDAEVSESAGALSFQVILSALRTSATVLDVATTAGTASAGLDFAPLSPTTTVTIPAGSTSATVVVVLAGDARDESAEQLTVTLANPPAGVSIADSSATGRIADDDHTATLRAGVVETFERSGTATVVVTLSRILPDAVTVTCAATAGSATNGTDYTRPPLTVTIPADQTTATCPVTILQDTTVEPSETITITLSNPTNAAIGDATAVVTVHDDDPT